MPTTYLTRPDQSLTVLIQGESGTGKSGLAQLINDMVTEHGAITSSHTTVDGGKADRIVIRSKTTGELRSEYLKSLNPDERSKLRYHLSSLGIDL